MNIDKPTITAFDNATHSHGSAAGGGTLSSATGLPLTTGVTGVLPIANGGAQLLGTAGSTSGIFWNADTINDNVTIGATQRAGSIGPVVVAAGKAVTITAGGLWKIL